MLFVYVFMVCLMLILLLIAIDSLRFSITPMPSSRKCREQMLAQASELSEGVIMDFGSGWGFLALFFAKRFPKHQVVGYEKSIVPFIFSKLLVKLSNVPNLRFEYKNFYEVDSSKSVLILCYLHPKPMQKLALKFENEKPLLVISNTFALPKVKVHCKVHAKDLYQSPIYVYKSAF